MIHHYAKSSAAIKAACLFCYLTLTAVLMPFTLRVIFKEASGERISVVDNHLINHQTPLETLSNNLADLWEANHILNGIPLIIVSVLALHLAGATPATSGALCAGLPADSLGIHHS